MLIVFFWSDWVKIIKGMWMSLVEREIKDSNVYAKLGWLLVVGTIPAGVIGLLFQDSLRAAFGSPAFAAFFLIVNGIILYLAEILRRRANNATEKNLDQKLAKVSWLQSLSIGAAQALALIPGISRSGSSMAGGLFIGLSNEEAARFSFLLATPIIFAAGALKLPDLANNHEVIGQAIVGAIAAGITAYFTVKFLVRFFQSNKLTPFAIYCVVAGITFLTVLSR